MNDVSEFLGEKALENLLAQDDKKHNETKEEMFKKFEGKYSKMDLSSAYDKIQKKTMRKSRTGVQVKLPVTAAHEMSTGMQPAAPPQTMFCAVRRFRRIV